MMKTAKVIGFSLLLLACGSQAGFSATYIQNFDTNTPSFPDASYPGWTYVGDDSSAAGVSSNALNFAAPSSGTFSSAVIDANSAFGMADFGSSFSVSAKLGGEAGGVGTYSVALQVGAVSLGFYPGYSGGAFFAYLLEGYGDITTGQNLGFTPATGTLYEMSVSVTTNSANNYHYAVVVTDGSNNFNYSFDQSIPPSIQGRMDEIGFIRYNGAGGNGVYDDLVITAVPEPSALALLVSGLGIAAFASRKRAKCQVR